MIVTTLLYSGNFYLTFTIGPKQFSVTREISVAHAATGGPNECGTAANDATVGTAAWNNTANGCATDASYADVAVTGTGISQYLKLTNFGFTTGDIPSGATIDGIEVAVDWYGNTSGSNDTAQNSIKIVQGGTVSGNEKSTGALLPNGTEGTTNFGATNDTWGVTWSDSDIRSTGFGVAFSVTGDSASGGKTVNGYIDTVRVTITYSTETDPPTPNPPYFTSAPASTSPSILEMTSVAGTDTSTPIEYYFTATSSTCTTNHNGTGGTNSGWQTSTSYSDSGLQANKCYGYQITMRDAVNNYTSTSTASSTYTRAAIPGVVTYSSVGVDSITISNTENGNPASNPTTDFTIYATSTDARWNQVYVTAAGGTTTSQTWLTDAQIDSLTLSNLLLDTQYDFVSVARNADGFVTASSSLSGTTTLADTFAPAPDPLYFTSAPANVSSSEIGMTTVSATDNTPPIEYYFTLDNATCGADAGTGGTDSGWQSGTSYNDIGLDVNKCYGYKVTSRDSLGNYSATSTASTTYTSANTPGAMTYANVGGTSLDIINAENSNPASNPTTQFAVYATSTDATWDNKYVDAAGDPSATPVWLTDAQIDNLTVNSLSNLTRYDFEVVAKNGDGDITASSTLTGTTTLDTTAPTPNPAYFTTAPNNDALGQISMLSVTVTDPTPTVNYYFNATTSDCAANFGSGATDSGWQVGASYIDVGLSPNQCYGYEIITRDGDGNLSATSTASSTYSSANVPGAMTYSSVGSSTIVITNAENSNPASNPTTQFAVYATSTDATWDNKYVDAAGDPSATPVWLTDAQIDGLTVNSLSNLTLYDFEVVARNSDGDITASSTLTGTTTLDTTAPTPNPPSFTSAPTNDAAGQLSMTSITVTDPTPTVNYYFNATTSDCAANFGSGATDSGWQSGTSYSDTGLQPNQCYGYEIIARDGDDNKTATSTASSAYTTANTPGLLTYTNVGSSTIQIINDENSNPASNPTTQFAVYATTSGDGTWHQKYVNASGDPSATPVWLTDAQIDNLTVRGLTELVSYEFVVVARNQDGDVTASSTLTSTTTLDLTAPVPDPDYFTTVPINDAVGQISMVVQTVSDLSSVHYYFTATSSGCTTNHFGSGATDSGWQVGASYIDVGLSPNQCYGYQITVRDSVGNYTATSTASTTYSSANTPGLMTFSSTLGTSTLIINAENSNPASNPTTQFAVYATSTDPTWDTMYVDASGNPTATKTWLTDAQIDNLLVNSLDYDTEYQFEVIARNADGDESGTSTPATVTTLPDTAAPTPNPTTFEQSTGIPTDSSASQVDMTANAVTDPTPTVNYYFTATSSTCTAGHFGTGGTDSGWQTSTSYSDTGLQPNQCYGYQITTKDGNNNIGATSTASSTYTAANVPGQISFSSVTGSSVDITNNENSNPASNPTTQFAVYATSTDATWDNKYVDAAGDPSATPVWLTDAQIDGLTVNSLSSYTLYDFEVVARNQDGDITASSTLVGTTTLDIGPPTPDPAYFITAPNNDAAAQIAMTSVTASDQSTPINYYFTNNNTACGANAGTGGTDSGWQSGTSYTDTGLDPNQCYGYEVTTRDAEGNYTSTSTASTTYSSANTPGAMTYANVGGTSLDIINAENSNPASNPTTQFAVYATSTDATWDNKYVDAAGDPSATPVWLTDAQIDNLTVNSLSNLTRYDFEVVAKNGDGDITASSTLTGTTTLDTTAPTPAPTFATGPSNDSVSAISMTSTVATDPSTPVEYYFTNDNSACGADAGTGGTDSGWQSSVSYTDSGLETNQCYGYKVTARDADGNYTATSSISSTYTSAAVPGTLTSTAAGENIITIQNDENGNPASSPATSFAVYVVSANPADATWESRYVDSVGDPTVTQTFLTDTQLDGLTIKGLTASTTYSFEVIAKNGDGDVTASSTADLSTSVEIIERTIWRGGRYNGLRFNAI